MFFEHSVKYTLRSRLVGPIASGKSSVGLSCSFHHSTVILTPACPKFIEKAAGIEGLSRGALGSSTKEISVFKFPFQVGRVDSSICLIDTPGIDGKERELYDVVDMIRDWFHKTYVQVLSFLLKPVIDICFD